jgi:outer membrane lipoprotein-sorting protein
MNVFADHPRARWAVPTGALACIAVGGLIANQAASASPDLAPRTAAQLLVDVQKARLSGLSGTVVQTSNLGLPELPGISSGSGMGGGSSSLSSMVSGTHTWRVWYAGQDKARIALLGSLGESDVVRNGRDLWVWSSKDKTASHTVLPQGQHRATLSPSELPATPQAAADQALAALDPTTAVTTSGSGKVNGRDAYELVLTPKRNAQGRATTLVAQVRIAVDAVEHVPLRVQIFSTRSANPAFEVSFSQVDFAKPDASTFSFNPPPGTTVTQSTPGAATPGAATPGAATPKGAAAEKAKTQAKAGEAATSAKASTKIVGSGWSTVVVGTVPAQLGALGTPAAPGSAGGKTPSSDRTTRQLEALLRNLPRTSGAWGSGRLLSGTLFSVLLTDDGRFAVGAVPPAQLTAALAAK